MKQTLSRSQVHDLISEDPHNSYSHDAIEAIIDDLEELESLSDEDFEIDTAEIRMMYTEYSSIKEMADELGFEDLELKGIEVIYKTENCIVVRE